MSDKVGSPVDWNLVTAAQPPVLWPAAEATSAGVQGIFFENVAWNGKATRVFAWLGLPHVAPGESCPAMVLLHGGGGTAFAEWVRIWNRRGYAAIAIDQCGCVPGTNDAPTRHAAGGPPGWDASFDAAECDPADQWVYHVVAAVSRALALLAAQPGVDAARIGITGISWGGYMTSIVAGVLKGFKCAVPVYGCGFLGGNSVWRDTIFPTMPPRRVERWLELWDPSVYLPSVHQPVCWVTGTNDFAYPLDSVQKSYRLPEGDVTLCIRVEMPHGHPDGWAPQEIGVFADSHLRGGAPLPQLLQHDGDKRQLWAKFDSVRPLLSAEVNFTRATGQWSDRKFNRLPAQLNAATGEIEALVPPNSTVCFLNVFDDRGCVVSTPHVEPAAT